MFSHERAEYDLMIHDIRRNDSGADRLCNVRAEHQKCDEVEKCRPGNGGLWPQHPRRNHGRDRVSGVVQTIEKIEDERDQHERNHGQFDHGHFWLPPAPPGAITRFRA